EARVADEINAGPAKRGVEFGIEGLARRVVAVADDLGRDARVPRDGDAAGIRLVRNDGDDLGGEISRLRRLDQRGEIGAAPRDENADPHARLPSAPSMTTRGSSSLRSRSVPMR